MYAVVRHVVTFAALSLLASACASDDFGADLGDESFAIAADGVGACPIPQLDDIPAHESVFYECAEQVADLGHGCGEAGYFLGYGRKYSQRFYKEARPRMSARGKQWIDEVLVCLQHDLREAIDETTSCEEIWNTAFDSHPACYVKAGFCTLAPLDIAQVIWTVDARDWLSRSAARQVLQTAVDCGHEYAGWLRFVFGYLLPT
jgi:Stanniocalcin family